MQKNEVIIEQFVKTINDSPMDVAGDPVLLGKIFDKLAKKKRRRKIFSVFLLTSMVLAGAGILILSLNNANKQVGQFVAMPVIASHQVLNYSNPVLKSNNLHEDTKFVPVKKSKKVDGKNQPANFSKSVTYKFNNHQVDVFKNGEEEFIQINVFGADGIEQDVLQIMEDLKKSYKNNSVYVDSVKHK